MQTHGTIALENHRVFPYIAWGVFIGFSVFTGSLVYNLYQTTEAIGEQSYNNQYGELQDELML